MNTRVWKFWHRTVLRHSIMKSRIHQHKRYLCSCGNKHWKLDYYS
jgi:hypothetical protein